MKCECSGNVLIEIEWTVPGITSRLSAEQLQMTLEEITAVRGVRINIQKQSVLVGFDAGYTSENKLKEVMKEAGFQIALSREELYRTEIFGSSEPLAVAA